MGSTAKAEQQARARARQRRLELDRDRAARDARLESSATEVFLALEQRDLARASIAEAETRAGAALCAILAESLTVAQAAELCDLEPGTVRTLARAAQAADAGPPAAAGASISRPADARPAHDATSAATGLSRLSQA